MPSWPGVLVLSIALAVALWANKSLRIAKAPSHNQAMDGLRGFLAFGVFLHHAVVWRFFEETGRWDLPPLPVYRELGLDCVNFFFMITAFLFVGKVLDGRDTPIDWSRLYVGRFLRIVPLYCLVACVLLLMVGQATGWTLRVPVLDLFQQAGRWLAFGMASTGAVNGYDATGMLIAFVTWTLAYEWMFYFTLPLIALVLRAQVRVTLVVFATAVAALIAYGTPHMFFPSAFVLGAVAAMGVRRESLARLFRGQSVAVIGLVAVGALLSGVIPHRAAMVVEAFVFLLVACGNSLLGILSNRAAVALGEVSYGIYLIHSLVLSALFLFVLGPEGARHLTPAVFWCVIAGVGAVVVVLSTLSYAWLELPALRRTKGWAGRLRSAGLLPATVDAAA